MPKIATNYWAKPIPIRKFDWSAWYDGDEPNDDGQMIIGHGATKQEAIDELFEIKPPPCVDCGGKGGVLPGIECATCEGSGERCQDDKLDPIIIV